MKTYIEEIEEFLISIEEAEEEELDLLELKVPLQCLTDDELDRIDFDKNY